MTTRRSRVRRIALGIAPALVVGAMVNALVATHGALFTTGFERHVRPPRPEWEPLWQRTVSKELGEDVDAFAYVDALTEETYVISATVIKEDGFEGDFLTWVRSGWPFRSFEGGQYKSYLEASGNQKTVARRFTAWVTPKQMLGARKDRVVPYGFLWPGLLANTAFYGGGYLLVVWVIGHLRRRARLGRKLCPVCAYDLRRSIGDTGIRCPECGFTMPVGKLRLPRFLLRWWMVPLMLPAAAYLAIGLGGMMPWMWVRWKLRYHDPILTPTGIICMILLFLLVWPMAWNSYADRGRWARLTTSILIAFLLTIPSYVCAFALILWLDGPWGRYCFGIR